VFGCKVNVKAPQPVQQPRNEIIYRTETASQPIAVAPKQRQATMDRYMLDSALVEAGKKKKEKKSGSKTTSTNN
jgi:hypothetical protein